MRKLSILFLSVIMSMGCLAFGSCNNQSGNKENSSQSEQSSDSGDSGNTGDSEKENENGVVGEMVKGVSFMQGIDYFQKDGSVEGMWQIAACQHGGYSKQYDTFKYVEDKNILTFSIRSKWDQSPLQGAFQLGFNEHVYTYRASTNKWYNEKGKVNENIVMKDDKGKDVNFASLKFKAKWPWTVFTIYGVNTEVEFIYDFAVAPTSNDCPWPHVCASVMDIYWNYDSKYDVEEDEVIHGTMEKGISYLNGEDKFVNNGDGSYEVGASQNDVYPKQYDTFKFVEDNNILKFAIRSKDTVSALHGTFKLGYNDHVYTYNSVDNLWYSEKGKKNENIIMENEFGTAINFANLSLVRGEWPFTVFTLNGVTTDVELIYDFEKAPSSGVSAEIYNIAWDYDIAYHIDVTDSGAVGTMEKGISFMNAGNWFVDYKNGTYQVAANEYYPPKQYDTFKAVSEDYNVISFAIKSNDVEGTVSTIAGAFKLGYNGKVYTYNKAENKWYGDDGNVNENIVMKDEAGEVVNFATLAAEEVEGVQQYPWTIFTIYGVNGDVEIIYDFENAPTLEGYGHLICADVKDILWTYVE